MAIDISGRHEVLGKYQMVCAAISARLSPSFIEKILCIRIVPCLAETIDLNTVADLVLSSCSGISGIIVAEPGDFYNLEVWRVKGILGRDFKHPETLAERRTIELAHHISLAGRRLLVGLDLERGSFKMSENKVDGESRLGGKDDRI